VGMVALLKVVGGLSKSRVRHRYQCPCCDAQIPSNKTLRCKACSSWLAPRRVVAAVAADKIVENDYPHHFQATDADVEAGVGFGGDAKSETPEERKSRIARVIFECAEMRKAA